MGVIASMTGYGRAEVRGGRIAVTAEVRALNHRFLEISLKLPRGLTAHEPDLRRLVQGRLTRGRVDVAVAVRRVTGSPSLLRADAALGAEYARVARALAASTDLPVGLTAADLLRLPGVTNLEETEPEDVEEAGLLKQAARDALGDLVRMRESEGAALGADLARHADAAARWIEEMDRLLPATLERIQQRVRERIEALLGQNPPDPARLAQEVATWAARADVAEELARLGSHLAQLRALLAQGGAVGRQLDFLAQELHREVNTIASKADDRETIARLLEARTLVERIREQVQNVE